MTDSSSSSGSLFHAKLQVLEGNNKDSGDSAFITFMFNPRQFVVQKTNTWKPIKVKQYNVGRWEFGGGEPRKITIEAFFDTALPRSGVSTGDVRTLTNKLFTIMLVDTSLKGTNCRIGRPPKCRLVWGQDSSYQFDCFLTDCTVTYTMFNTTGVPLRATANLSLSEAKDPVVTSSTNPTSRGDPGRRVWRVNEGDRLDWIAYKEYGDANQWRRIAEANGIDNPLALQPGMILAIPST